MSSMSKMHKANTNARKAQGKAPLSFAEYAEFCDRAANARAARGSKPVHKIVKAAAVKAAAFERVEKRVDCFSVNAKGIITLGVDKADHHKVAKLVNGVFAGAYTSKRGERVRIVTNSVNVAKLTAAGFTPKGF
jgi:hypothetical protein